MNGYIALYRGKRHEVYADTLLAARDEAAAHFKARKAYEVSVTLCEIDGVDVVHRAVD